MLSNKNKIINLHHTKEEMEIKIKEWRVRWHNSNLRKITPVNLQYIYMTKYYTTIKVFMSIFILDKKSLMFIDN